MKEENMKKISILIPCYNEEENVGPIYEAVIEEFKQFEEKYELELLFIDNDSTDNTRPLLREICHKDKRVKAIFNAKNFGQFNSPYYGMLQATGDCVITMVCDFQDPVELIGKYIAAWEEGYKIVIGIKTSSKENKFVYWIRSIYYKIVSCIKTASNENSFIRFLRTCYYKMIKKFSDVEQIEHFTGSGLYDRSFVEILRDLKDPTPFMRGIVAELGYKRKEIEYEQPLRRAGKTKNNFYE